MKAQIEIKRVRFDSNGDLLVSFSAYLEGELGMFSMIDSIFVPCTTEFINREEQLVSIVKDTILKRVKNEYKEWKLEKIRQEQERKFRAIIESKLKDVKLTEKDFTVREI